MDTLFLYTAVQNRRHPVKVWQRLEDRLAAGMREVHAFLVKRGAGESEARAHFGARRLAAALESGSKLPHSTNR
ncbi:MAG: hypothetical protein PHX41_11665, partial [Kiritimatiellae bacterium]|nr:hypothetical protein [Kiritimatiellia bacterium]